MANLGAQQFQDLIDAIVQHVLPAPAAAGAGAGGGRAKLKEFSSGEGVEWLTWRNHFEKVAQINVWDDARKLLEIQAAMGGKAAQQVAGVEPVMPAAGVVHTTPPEFLDIYQNRFLPPAASRMARSTFDVAKQEPSEDVLTWHARIKSHYRRAHPNDENWETSNNLIDRFVLHLADSEVAKYVFDHQPANIDAALEHAQNKTANQASFTHQRTGRAAHHLMINSVEAMEEINFATKPSSDKKNLDCWCCGSKDHMRSDCPDFKRQKEYWAKYYGATPGSSRPTSNRSRGGWRGRRGRGRFTRRGGRMNANMDDPDRRQPQSNSVSEIDRPLENDWDYWLGN